MMQGEDMNVNVSLFIDLQSIWRSSRSRVIEKVKFKEFVNPGVDLLTPVHTLVSPYLLRLQIPCTSPSQPHDFWCPCRWFGSPNVPGEVHIAVRAKCTLICPIQTSHALCLREKITS